MGRHLRFFLFVFLGFTAFGCATTTSRQDPVVDEAEIVDTPSVPGQPEQGQPEQGQSEQLETLAAEAPVVVVPKKPGISQLSEDVLYKLLVAEIAGQRGKIDIALHNYLELLEVLPDPRIAERATRIAVFARSTEKALAAGERWLALAPDNIDAHQIVAAMHIRSGNVEQALEHLEFVLAAEGPESNEKLLMIANFLGREDDKEAALSIMARLVEQREGEANALLAYALLAIRVEDIDRARSAMDQVEEIAPENLSIAMAYLSVLARTDNDQIALDWLETVLTRDFEQFELRLVYARMLADAKRFEEARTQFGMLAEQKPEHADVRYALGLLYLQANQLEEAKKHLLMLVGVEEREADAHFYLGQLLEAQKNYAQAENHFRSVVDGEHQFDSKLRIVMLLAEQGRIDGARAYLKTIRAVGSEDVLKVVRVEGEILVEEGQYDVAMAVYDAALEKHFDTELLYTRAMLAEKMDALDILERDLRAILESEPDNAQALNALGYTLADRTDRFQEAHELIARALELSPNDFYILDSMGWVLYRLGRLEEALPHLRKAREIRNDPEVAAHLAEVLWVLGDRDGARDVWESALKVTPDDETLLDVIERLAP